MDQQLSTQPGSLPPSSAEFAFTGYPEIAPVPARVDAKVSMRITMSAIPSAGRGIIVLQNVAAGDHLFNIDQPSAMS